MALDDTSKTWNRRELRPHSMYADSFNECDSFLLTRITVLVLLRDFLCTHHFASQSQHWILLAQSSNRQTPCLDHPPYDGTYHSLWSHSILCLYLPMRSSQRFLVIGTRERKLPEHHCACGTGLRHLGPQRCCRLDIRSFAILDCQGSPNTSSPKATRHWPTGFCCYR
jgi:hypothetical protein